MQIFETTRLILGKFDYIFLYYSLQTSIVSNFFQYNSSIHQYPTHIALFKKPHAHSIFLYRGIRKKLHAQSSFLYRGIKEWNSLEG